MIGVHAPEFAFEKDIDNVRRAVKEMQINYPVAIDNEHAIWRAFKNNYWPALYFIDAQGRVRHHHFGEGAYEQSEKFIQELLAEAGASDVDRDACIGRRPAVSRRPPIGAACSPARTMSGTSAPRTSHRPAGRSWISPAPILPARLRLNQWALIRRLDGAGTRRWR